MTSLAKKGGGIQFRIPQEPSEDVAGQGDTPAERVEKIEPRSGVGRIAMAVTLGRDVKQQFEEQKVRLAEYEKGAVVIQVDPRRVRRSQFANRHEANFSTPEFEAFKADIAESGGNLVPVKVRPSKSGEGTDFELVYGHRRLQACLELGVPLRALVQDVDDLELFVDMDRENRGRASLSAWEQGVMYSQALDKGLFNGQRALASRLGISQGLVSQALSIGRLPQEVIGCFSSPVVITFKIGRALADAVAKDPVEVQKRAARLFGRSDFSDGQVLKSLLGEIPVEKVDNVSSSSDLWVGKRRIGSYRCAVDGTLIVELRLPLTSSRAQADFLEVLRSEAMKALKTKSAAD